MSTQFRLKAGRGLILTAAAALGFAVFATSANAQPETVYVIAPRPYYYYGPAFGPAPDRSYRGGDIVEASLSQPVTMSDLDLSTPWGAHELRNRVRQTAELVCERLDRLYPVKADDSPPCYERAVYEGMRSADAAIEEARHYADR